MIAVYKTPQIRAHLVVKDDGGAADVAGLKGKICAVPFRSREHCRLFLEKQCEMVCKGTPASFFEKVTKPLSAETAMDEVLMGKVGAAVIDEVLYENYRDVKPGCFARLRILKTSDVFPSAVVAYKQGAVSDEMLNRFRDGMISANRNERGRDLMNLWKITSFETAPADFGETVANIVQGVPGPGGGDAGVADAVIGGPEAPTPGTSLRVPGSTNRRCVLRKTSSTAIRPSVPDARRSSTRGQVPGPDFN